jgi:hypothetical protein
MDRRSKGKAVSVPNDDYLIRLTSAAHRSTHRRNQQRGKHDELLEWHDPEELQPDNGELVLLHVPGLIYPGYLDVDEWRWPDGGIVESDVIEWAKMPKGTR